jgi:methylmalonyl-CoA mutase N-terminal domain/subunit
VLQELNDRATGGENIMPAVIAAVEARCTLGEIADTLREVFGEYR